MTRQGSLKNIHAHTHTHSHTRTHTRRAGWWRCRKGAAWAAFAAITSSPGIASCCACLDASRSCLSLSCLIFFRVFFYRLFPELSIFCRHTALIFLSSFSFFLSFADTPLCTPRSICLHISHVFVFRSLALSPLLRGLGFRVSGLGFGFALSEGFRV